MGHAPGHTGLGSCGWLGTRLGCGVVAEEEPVPWTRAGAAVLPEENTGGGGHAEGMGSSESCGRPPSCLGLGRWGAADTGLVLKVWTGTAAGALFSTTGCRRAVGRRVVRSSRLPVTTLASRSRRAWRWIWIAARATAAPVGTAQTVLPVSAGAAGSCCLAQWTISSLMRLHASHRIAPKQSITNGWQKKQPARLFLHIFC